MKVINDEFETVEEKKNGDRDRDYRRKGQQSHTQNVTKQKLQARHLEDKDLLKHSHTGPQMTRKRQKWQQQTMRANQAGNLSQYTGGYQRRGLREPSYEIKPEWPVLVDFTKQRQDKLLNLTPGILGESHTAGQIHTFDMKWEKCTVMRSKKIPALVGVWEETSILEDEYV